MHQAENIGCSLSIQIRQRFDNRFYFFIIVHSNKSYIYNKQKHIRYQYNFNAFGLIVAETAGFTLIMIEYREEG
jgi:hypothetical protein